VASERSERDVTLLLQAWSGGSQEAAERVIPMVYGELRRQAAQCLRRERRGHTLRPTALVHEAWLRLAEGRGSFPSRTAFFATAATVMRHILVDHARRRGAAKRAGSWCRVTLDEGLVLEAPRDVDVLALEEALCALAAQDPPKARMVDLRFFGGLTLEETAEAMGVSMASVSREWRVARAWLYRRLRGGGAR